ncbi:hypothetical protein [Burkholderia sp. Bp9142]|uniref:hypothetical protein n=1 Tax=Burkholderia sp. Bp9142 TaxID=2184573 RepID=UPI000F5B80DE|nr:hypothetical protein [Burkholderia sp. Bp9142]
MNFDNPNKGQQKKRSRVNSAMISLSAEYLVMGHLLRRNILTHKAPLINKAYDLVCTLPYRSGIPKPIRIRIEKRYRADRECIISITERSIDAFDFLVLTCLNVDYSPSSNEKFASTDYSQEPTFYSLPADFLRKHHDRNGDQEAVILHGVDIEAYKGMRGFELISEALGISQRS